MKLPPSIVEKVEESVFLEIDKIIEKWASENGWSGFFDHLAGETTIRRKNWPILENGIYAAYIQLREESDSGVYYLGTLLGASSNRYGFAFCVDVSTITRIAGRGTSAGKEWKKFLQEKYPSSGLKDFGFELGDGFLFLPFSISPEKLAADYPDSIVEALGPLDEVLNNIGKSVGCLDGLLQLARDRWPE